MQATPPDAAKATLDSETTIDSLVDGRAAEHTPLFLAVAQVAAGGAAFGALSGFEYVAMARALLREPDLLHRMQQGSADRGACIHCNKCMPTIYTGTRCVLVTPEEQVKVS